MKTIPVRGIDRLLIVSAEDYEIMSEYDWRYDLSDPEPLTALDPITGYDTVPESVLFLNILKSFVLTHKVPRFKNGNNFDFRRENIVLVHRKQSIT
jgi:hypothetical protein